MEKQLRLEAKKLREKEKKQSKKAQKAAAAAAAAEYAAAADVGLEGEEVFEETTPATATEPQQDANKSRRSQVRKDKKVEEETTTAA